MVTVKDRQGGNFRVVFCNSIFKIFALLLLISFFKAFSEDMGLADGTHCYPLIMLN